tara:strand:- start:3264 stop:3476 length:213 start_codon:yes stop_codon:yes gene_type:complete
LKHKKAVNKALKFMGLGATLGASIGLGAIGGRKLDDHLNLEKPLGTACGALLGLALGMWTVVKSLRKQEG